jgi:hypothetical protein
MSLDVHLEDENGRDLYWGNVTHNLTKMAARLVFMNAFGALKKLTLQLLIS